MSVEVVSPAEIDSTASYGRDGEQSETEAALSVFCYLDALVSDSYKEHGYSAAASSSGCNNGLSAKDLDFSKTCCRPQTTQLDILDAWTCLLETLKRELVFVDYITSLERAFSSTANNKNHRHCIRTLLKLLTQAAREHARDKSIECRFVTLLEVLLSYGENWEPSKEVSRFWVRLMQRIPVNVAPVNFRRKAYRVLVSLSWVPSSKGLLEACSFEESRQVLDFEKAPAGVREHMARIRDGPLPRYDSVNQLLDRLKDETDVCVAITSETQGLGKTTLAGQVASHPSILRVFKVLWLNDVAQPMSYDQYIKHLTDLCQQLGLPVVNWPTNIKRFEEPALRKLREKHCMVQAKQQMSNTVKMNDSNILLVLDNIHDSEVIDWFRFNDRQSVIVTTTDTALNGVDWALELVPMGEEEAIELFLKEAGHPVDHILGSTSEVRSIVLQCNCNPLCVRTIARWYQLKRVTAGASCAIEEIMQELSSLSSSQPFSENNEAVEIPNMMLFDILSLMMGPARNSGNSLSALFVLCFAAQVVVFPDAAPLDAILLLWEEILKNEPLAVEELGKECSPETLKQQAWFIAEGLTLMGVISMLDTDGTPWVHVHHGLYKAFAILMAKEMDLKDTFEETAASWHMAFVTGYLSRKSQGEDERHDSSWEYTIEKLPSHMFDGKMGPTAEVVLAEQHFVQARIEAIGWKRGIETQIEDCVVLQHELEEDCEQNGNEPVVSSVFGRTATLLKNKQIGPPELSPVERADEEARALYLLGFALTENGFFEEALEHFESAEKLSPSNQSLQASILYATGWCLLSANQNERAKTKLNASRIMMEQASSLHDLYEEMLQLYADALVEVCEYKEAALFLETVLGNLRKNPANNPIELGTALFRFGRLHHVMGQTTQAKATLDECVKWKLEIGETSRSLAAALNILGDINVELRQVGEAKERYEAALKTLNTLNCDDQHLDYRLLAGKLQFLRNDFAFCMESFELVRKTSIESPLTVQDQSAYDLRHIARAYETRGDLDTSITVLRESLLLTKDRNLSLEKAWGKIALGNCLVKQGEDKVALICYEQAFEIQQETLGESVQLADTVNLIGSVFLTLGENDDALELLKKNLETMKRIASNDSERVASVLYLIGDACDAKGDFASATLYFKECLHTIKQDRSRDHPDIAKTLHRLGDVTAAQNDLNKASQYYSQALDIRRMNFDDKVVADTIYCIGLLARKRGEFDLAQKSLEEALEIRKKNGNSRGTGETLLELGNLYRLRLQPQKAMTYYEESLNVAGDDDVLLGNVQLAMGHAKLSQGDYAGALIDYKCVRFTRLASYGEDDVRTGNASRSMGIAKFLMGDSDESLDYLSDFVRVCENTGGECIKSADFFVVQLALGDIYDAAGKADQAKASWTRAKEIYDCNSDIAASLPTSIHSLSDRRLGGAKGYLSRLKEASSQGDSQGNELDDEEVVLQSMIFVDD